MTGGSKSWGQLTVEKLNESNPTEPYEIVNLAIPGTTTTALVDRLKTELEKRRPAFIISMMGTNDSPGFWYNDHRLIDSNSIKSKIYILRWLNYLANMNDFKKAEALRNLRNSQAEEQTRNQHFDVPQRDLILEKLKKTDLNSQAWQKNISEIENSLAEKPKTERAAFFMWLSTEISPPFGNPIIEFKKAYDLVKRSHIIYSNINHQLEYILYLARLFEDRQYCKFALEKSIADGSFISEVSLNRIIECLPNEKEYTAKIISQTWPQFKYVDNRKLPTATNYRYVAELTKKFETCWIAMTYPFMTADENILQFSDSAEWNERIFLLENNKIFDAAVAEFGYDALFFDRFHEKYGHMTAKGASLVRDNLVNFIEKLRSEKKCGFQ